MNSQATFAPEPVPEIHTINGIECISASDAATFLDVHYSTIYNLVNSRFQYLKAQKIGSTLFITWESAQAEKIRRDALKRDADELAAQINAEKTEVAA